MTVNDHDKSWQVISNAYLQYIKFILIFYRYYGIMFLWKLFYLFSVTVEPLFLQGYFFTKCQKKIHEGFYCHHRCSLSWKDCTSMRNAFLRRDVNSEAMLNVFIFHIEISLYYVFRSCFKSIVWWCKFTIYYHILCIMHILSSSNIKTALLRIR